jgi:formyl-CoA transferase
MVLTTSTDRTFYRLADVMGRSDMKTDPRYATNIERVKRRTEVHAIVQEWFKAHDAGEIQEIFDKNGIPVSPIYNMADIFQDPQYKARGALVEVDHPVLGKIKLPNVIPKFSQTPGTVRKTGASIGEHNFEIFTELGLSLEDINELKEEGVI